MLRWNLQRLKYKNRLDEIIVFNQISELEFTVYKEEKNSNSLVRTLISEGKTVAIDFEGGPYLSTGAHILYNTDPIIEEPRECSMGSITPEWGDLVIDSIEYIQNDHTFQNGVFKIICKYAKEIVWEPVK